MKHLLLVRHGESEHLVRRLTGGWTDLPLTGKGRQQAHQTGDCLRRWAPFKPTVLLSSDLRRAAETAEIVAAAISIEVQFSADLRELNNGAAAGLTQDQANLLQIARTEPVLDWVPYPGGESWRALYRRLANLLASLDASKVESTIIVSHANAIICMINWWLRLNSDDNLQNIMYDIRPCSITYLTLDPDNVRRVVLLNDINHLSNA
jgi:2,3-bisphosphoglycerate-dependent phosphoglycerate mutase